MSAELHWLPTPPGDWSEQLAALKNASSEFHSFESLVQLSQYRLDFVQTSRLDRVLQRLFGVIPAQLSSTPVRLALLASSTVAHLLPGIRVGGLRRKIWIQVYESDYGQYWQELTDNTSALHEFKPNVVLFAFDARHLLGSADSTVEGALDLVSACWQTAKASFACTVIQQTILPVLPALVGNNEHKFRQSAYWKIQEFNWRLRELAERHGVPLLSLDKYAETDGIKEWHDLAIWHRAKQEVHPRVSHIYGDLVGRLIAAAQGRSYKCAALDLDNTLWGGVIGDDGMAGIALGQGHAVGEAYIEFQRYLQGLASRGIILAVCSKNDELNALEPFRKHPEMVLRESDIACFVANWNDKVANLRHIAERLKIGIDSIVFIDDNPFERNLVRQELPMVAVPEMPEDPACYVACLSEAGYFEALSLTEEDRQRSLQYRDNLEREQVKQNSADLPGYLRALNMEMVCGALDPVSLPRIVQLINKTNQFNLTTRRYSEAEVRSMMADSSVITLHFRLTDRFGDNGLIAVVIGKLNAGGDLLLDSWLMSCRVLGRQVEETTLNVLAAVASTRNVSNLIGEYLPTAKNEMVKDLYKKLGFSLLEEKPDGSSRWVLDLGSFQARQTFIRVLQD